MAKGPRKFLTHTVEERLARRVLERFSLSVPVDVVALIEKFADFEEVEFPVAIDGVSLHIKSPFRRPQVLLSSRLPIKRKRFTVAHELGHIVIPWHAGSIVDNISIGNKKSEGRYKEKEAEANRFAAELLMPYAWADTLIEKSENFMAGVAAIAAEANVSLEAAALRAQRIGKPNVIVALSSNGIIVRAGRTEGTRANLPQKGAKFHRDMVSPFDRYSNATSSAGKFHAWELGAGKKLPRRPESPSKDILANIFADLGIVGDKSTWASIHGIVSVANGSVREGRTKEKIYSAILHNTSNRNDSSKRISRVLSHPKFHEFVVSRVYEYAL